jgi:hypothetical protein
MVPKFNLKAVSICLALLLSQISELASYSRSNYLRLNIVSKPNLPLFVMEQNGVYDKFIFNPALFARNKRKASIQTTEIFTTGNLNNHKLAKFLLKHNKDIDSKYAFRFASSYIKECKIEGINHDVAFAQMCLETGFLKFGGSVEPSQNNFCGLGAISNKHCGDSFKSKREGIIAHVQHLKAYVSKESIKTPLVDKRFKFVKRGSVKTIFDLSGKWATDPFYGKKIQKLLSQMYSI